MEKKHIKVADRGKGRDGLRVAIRTYYSLHHLWASEYFSTQAKKIEDQHSGRSRFDIKHRAYVTNAIFSSVAFLEAAINEMYQDIADEHGSYVSPLKSEVKNRIKEFWNLTEEKDKTRFSIIDKYQLALILSNNSPFSTDHGPLQNVLLIIRLRNILVHYKPETLARDIEHKIERQLRDKFSENSLMKGSANPYFPDKCLGHGCAKWSIDSSKLFADEFFKKMQIQPNYQIVEL